jgi:chorismate mutase
MTTSLLFFDCTQGSAPTMTKVCRGVRGATTVETDDRETILKATRELLALVIHLNDIHKEDVASAMFTTTVDLNAAFPATAARQLGWLDVPLMCMHEIEVPGSLRRCIRVLLHWNTDRAQTAIQHVYLKEAQTLRPDKTVVLSGVDMQELNHWIEDQLAQWHIA